MRNLLSLALWLAIGFGLTALVARELEKSHTVQQQVHDLRDVRSAEAPVP
jgi:hypothetical protein